MATLTSAFRDISEITSFGVSNVTLRFIMAIFENVQRNTIACKYKKFFYEIDYLVIDLSMRPQKDTSYSYEQ